MVACVEGDREDRRFAILCPKVGNRGGGSHSGGAGRASGIFKRSAWGSKMNYTGAAVGALLGIGTVSLVESISPVVMHMRAEPVAFDGSDYRARVIGRKIKDCDPVANSFIGWYEVNRVWYETPFQFLNDPTPNSSRPGSYSLQSFGIWEWQNLPDDAKRVRMTVQHTCGGDFTVTTVGPFDVEVTE